MALSGALVARVTPLVRAPLSATHLLPRGSQLLALAQLVPPSWHIRNCRLTRGIPNQYHVKFLQARAMAGEASTSTELYFGKWKLDSREAFFETPLSVAIVNEKPVVPGHVLVMSRRLAPRFADLSAEEAADLWLVAQRVGKVIEPHYGATSLTFAIQDGPQAGQTVPHVHIHILPRKTGDFKKNDDVYDAIGENAEALAKKGEQLDLDKERKVRSIEEMAEEAAVLRALF